MGFLSFDHQFFLLQAVDSGVHQCVYYIKIYILPDRSVITEECLLNNGCVNSVSYGFEIVSE